MTVFLNEYLRLEQEMLRLDADADADADGALERESDEVRDLMDLVWARLTSEERGQLNSRAIVFDAVRPQLVVRVGADFAVQPLSPTEREPSGARRLELSVEELWSAA